MWIRSQWKRDMRASLGRSIPGFSRLGYDIWKIEKEKRALLESLRPKAARFTDENTVRMNQRKNQCLE